MGITNLMQTDEFFNNNVDFGTYINLNNSATGEVLTYVEVVNFHNGTPMTDGLLDGYVYRKKDSKFYCLCFDKRIQNFLEKYTTVEFRAMTLTELYLIELGYYSGVSLHGYYEMGDTPQPIIYTLANTVSVDNGGSTFVVLGKVFNHKFLGGVDGLYFGVQSNVEAINLQAFQNWQKYVNETSGIYFQLTNKGSSFALFEPLYLRKSFIGINDPVFMYRVDCVGKVVSATEKTFDGTQSFDVKAVIGINPSDYSDTGDRLEFRNMKIHCTSGDGDEVKAQDYGIYFPVGTSVILENILVVRPNVAGFKFITLWMSELKRLNSWGSRKNGFEMYGTFTSIQMSNCYAHTFKERGFMLAGVMYSTFSNLGADGGQNARAAYSIGNTYGCTFQSLGSEGSTLDHLFYFADFDGSISNVYCLGNTFKDSIFYGFQDSNLQISNIKLDRCHRFENNTVHSFKFNNQLNKPGDDYFINYTDLNDKFTLGTYECPLDLMSKGTYTFTTKKKTRSFIDGVWKEVVVS
ncbi:hypothetical protein [Chryseobacterium sp. M5A1_1a]